MITSLSFSKVIVIHLDNALLKVRGCRYTKLIDSRYRYNRYRYRFSLAVRDCLSIAGTM